MRRTTCGIPASPPADQCEGCTFNTGHVLELSYYDESARYRDFMGWEMPWYSVPEESSDRLLAGRHVGMKVCYLRDGDRVFETYWTTARGCEAMGNSYGIAALLGRLRTKRGEAFASRMTAGAFLDRPLVRLFRRDSTRATLG